MDEHLTGTLL